MAVEGEDDDDRGLVACLHTMDKIAHCTFHSPPPPPPLLMIVRRRRKLSEDR